MLTHVYVITASSESGGEYGPFVFAEEPTEEQKKQLIRERCDWFDDDGPGDYGSYTYLKVSRVPIE